MRVLKVLGVLVVLVILAFGIMFAVGSRMPHEHTASASVILSAPQARVWQIIEDSASQPKWRKELVSVEAHPDENGHHCWTEVQKHMRMPLCEDLSAPPSNRIVRIADPTLPFGGVWVYELTAIDATSSSLSITENGTTGPALFRFLGHYVFHEDSMIKQYESELQGAVLQK